MRRLLLATCAILAAARGGMGQSPVITPSRVVFSYTAFSPDVPAPQTVQVTSSTGGNVSFTGSLILFDPYHRVSNDYLTVSPKSGTTPATLTVAPIPENFPFLGPGAQVTYWLYIGFSTDVERIAVVLEVAEAPPPTITSVVNGASFQPGPVAPGEIITIFGTNLGPPGGFIPPYSFSYIYSTQVDFHGLGAPLLYKQSSQMNTIVPYGVVQLPGVTLVVNPYGTRSPPLELAMAETAPAIFSYDGTGSGQGAILNTDNTYNSQVRPAPKGSTIQIFGTGAGLMTPDVPAGTRVVGPPWPVPLADVSVMIGGVPARVTYAGAAPLQVSGVLQVNAVVPEGIDSGSQPIVLTIGKNSNSQQQVTVAVQ